MVELPAGPVTLEVTRGLEYRPVRRTLAVAAGETRQASVALERIADWPARGWGSGDLHVHMNYGGAYRATPLTLRAMAEAEDLHVVFNLTVNKEQRIPDIGWFTGEPDPASTSRTLLRHDQEFHTSFWGHQVLLGLRSHVLLPDSAGSPPTPAASLHPANAIVADLARAQGALVGYVHPFDNQPDHGALSGGKVGGLGDVIGEVPPALARKGCSVSVVTPSYGFLHRRHEASAAGMFSFLFFGGNHQAALHSVKPASDTDERVRHYVIDHTIFAPSAEGFKPSGIYCTDPAEAPFATDATRFAFFGAAVAEAFKKHAFGTVDVLHLHDWHAAFLMILCRYGSGYRDLGGVRCVFSIHNLAFQGIRPFEGSPSSLAAW